MTNQIQTHRISTLEEHSNLLREALQTAKQRVVISSPFISTHAIKADNVPEQIYKTVGRGVKVSVYIDDLFGQDDQGNTKSDTADGVRMLIRAGADVYVVNGIHSKTLIRDNNLISEGSFNWLSAVRKKGAAHQRMEDSIALKGAGVAATTDAAVAALQRAGKKIDLEEKETAAEKGKRETNGLGAGIIIVSLLGLALGDSDVSLFALFVGFLLLGAGSFDGHGWGMSNDKVEWDDDWDENNDPTMPGSAAWYTAQLHDDD